MIIIKLSRETWWRCVMTCAAFFLPPGLQKRWEPGNYDRSALLSVEKETIVVPVTLAWGARRVRKPQTWFLVGLNSELLLGYVWVSRCIKRRGTTNSYISLWTPHMQVIAKFVFWKVDKDTDHTCVIVACSFPEPFIHSRTSNWHGNERQNNNNWIQTSPAVPVRPSLSFRSSEGWNFEELFLHSLSKTSVRVTLRQTQDSSRKK